MLLVHYFSPKSIDVAAIDERRGAGAFVEAKVIAVVGGVGIAPKLRSRDWIPGFDQFPV